MQRKFHVLLALPLQVCNKKKATKQDFYYCFISFLGGFIAVGSDDGRIRIYNDNWDILYTERHFSVRVTSISFIFGERF